jgi:hypothetical protein
VQEEAYEETVSREALVRQERFAVEASKAHPRWCRCELCRVARAVAEREWRFANRDGSRRVSKAVALQEWLDADRNPGSPPPPKEAV